MDKHFHSSQTVSALFFIFIVPCFLFSKEEISTNNHGLSEPICKGTKSGFSVCKGLVEVVDPNNKEENFVIVVSKDNKEFERWNSESDQYSSLDVFDFENKNDLVILDHLFSTNGFGLKVSELNILNYPNGSRLRFVVHDYSKELLNLDGTVCATEWVKIRNKNNSQHLYFVSREFKITNGELLIYDSKPVLERKFDNGFEEERNSIAFAHHPDIWLKKAVVTGKDPWLEEGGEKEDVFIGNILKSKNEILAYEIHVTENGKNKVYLYPSHSDEKYDPRLIIDRIGDLKSRRLYPPDYIPADIKKWLMGKNGNVEVIPSISNDWGSSKFKIVLWI